MPQRVLVTGGASGIGAATVARFRAGGALVAALDISAEKLAGVGAEVHVVADVGDEQQVGRAVDEAAAALGGLDTLVAAAGVGIGGTVPETSLAVWEAVFRVNVTGVFLAARAAIPHLRAAGGGSIVAIASQHGLVAMPGIAAYAASKGAVIQLVRAMANDHAPEGIRVNAVCPGPTATPMLEGHFARQPDPAAVRRWFEEMTLHGRLVEPEEIADAVWYLAGPGAASVHGHALVVDGGYIVR